MYDYVQEYFDLIKVLNLYYEIDKECCENWTRIILDCNFDADLAVAVVEIRLREIIKIKEIRGSEEDLEFYKGVLRLVNGIYDFEKR